MPFPGTSQSGFGGNAPGKHRRESLGTFKNQARLHGHRGVNHPAFKRAGCASGLALGLKGGKQRACARDAYRRRTERLVGGLNL